MIFYALLFLSFLLAGAQDSAQHTCASVMRWYTSVCQVKPDCLGVTCNGHFGAMNGILDWEVNECTGVYAFSIAAKFDKFYVTHSYNGTERDVVLFGVPGHAVSLHSNVQFTRKNDLEVKIIMKFPGYPDLVVMPDTVLKHGVICEKHNRFLFSTISLLILATCFISICTVMWKKTKICRKERNNRNPLPFEPFSTAPPYGIPMGMVDQGLPLRFSATVRPRMLSEAAPGGDEAEPTQSPDQGLQPTDTAATQPETTPLSPPPDNPTTIPSPAPPSNAPHPLLPPTAPTPATATGAQNTNSTSQQHLSPGNPWRDGEPPPSPTPPSEVEIAMAQAQATSTPIADVIREQTQLHNAALHRRVSGSSNNLSSPRHHPHAHKYLQQGANGSGGFERNPSVYSTGSAYDYPGNENEHTPLQQARGGYYGEEGYDYDYNTTGQAGYDYPYAPAGENPAAADNTEWNGQDQQYGDAADYGNSNNNHAYGAEGDSDDEVVVVEEIDADQIDNVSLLPTNTAQGSPNTMRNTLAHVYANGTRAHWSPQGGPGMYYTG